MTWQDMGLYWAWHGENKEFQPPPYSKRVEYATNGVTKQAYKVVDIYADGTTRETLFLGCVDDLSREFGGKKSPARQLMEWDQKDAKRRGAEWAKWDGTYEHGAAIVDVQCERYDEAFGRFGCQVPSGGCRIV